MGKTLKDLQDLKAELRTVTGYIADLILAIENDSISDVKEAFDYIKKFRKKCEYGFEDYVIDYVENIMAMFWDDEEGEQE